MPGPVQVANSALTLPHNTPTSAVAVSDRLVTGRWSSPAPIKVVNSCRNSWPPDL